MHDAHLQRHPEATDKQRRQRLQLSETIGLECAVWPHLFWITEATLAYERATDVRHWKPLTIEHLLFPGQHEPEVDEDDWWLRHSIRHYFTSLLMGSILNYSTSFELLQIVHDFSLWPTLGAKKNLVNATMRIMTQNLSFVPLYWKRIQYGLVDLVRQLGPLFFFGRPLCTSGPSHITNL